MNSPPLSECRPKTAKGSAWRIFWRAVKTAVSPFAPGGAGFDPLAVDVREIDGVHEIALGTVA
jgi:hypothetical protein